MLYVLARTTFANGNSAVRCLGYPREQAKVSGLIKLNVKIFMALNAGIKKSSINRR